MGSYSVTLTRDSLFDDLINCDPRLRPIRRIETQINLDIRGHADQMPTVRSERDPPTQTEWNTCNDGMSQAHLDT